MTEDQTKQYLNDGDRCRVCWTFFGYCLIVYGLERFFLTVVKVFEKFQRLFGLPFTAIFAAVTWRCVQVLTKELCTAVFSQLLTADALESFVRYLDLPVIESIFWRVVEVSCHRKETSTQALVAPEKISGA